MCDLIFDAKDFKIGEVLFTLMHHPIVKNYLRDSSFTNIFVSNLESGSYVDIFFSCINYINLINITTQSFQGYNSLYKEFAIDKSRRCSDLYKLDFVKISDDIELTIDNNMINIGIQVHQARLMEERQNSNNSDILLTSAKNYPINQLLDIVREICSRHPLVRFYLICNKLLEKLDIEEDTDDLASKHCVVVRQNLDLEFRLLEQMDIFIGPDSWGKLLCYHTNYHLIILNCNGLLQSKSASKNKLADVESGILLYYMKNFINNPKVTNLGLYFNETGKLTFVPHVKHIDPQMIIDSLEILITELLPKKNNKILDLR